MGFSYTLLSFPVKAITLGKPPPPFLTVTCLLSQSTTTVFVEQPWIRPDLLNIKETCNLYTLLLTIRAILVQWCYTDN